MSKAERTIEFILETVAPIFNKNGYNGTSMSTITRATGLSKGAVYGNFENKEELALKSFNHNIKKVFNKLSEAMDPEERCIDKLKAMTKFYRNYPALTSDLGGCPLLNVGVDSNNQNELLAKRVTEVNLKLQRNFTNLIQAGIDQHQVDQAVDSKKIAGRIIAMIEGSVYMTFTLHDDSYIKDMMDHIDRMIETEMTI